MGDRTGIFNRPDDFSLAMGDWASASLYPWYRLKGGLPYNTDCFSYWQGTIQASYAAMRQLLFTQIVQYKI